MQAQPPDTRPQWPEQGAWEHHRGHWNGGPPRVWMAVGCLVAFLFFFGVPGIFMLGWIIIGSLFRIANIGDAIVAPGVALSIVLLVALFFAARSLRRFGRPLGELIGVVRAVESGDYSVRVPEARRMPGAMRTLVRAMNEMIARLESDETRRRSLLADVSHELRTPLTVIRGKVEAIKDGIYPADDAHLDAILDDVQTMSRLVEDLRTLVLSEGGTLTLHREPTDIASVMDNVAGDFQPIAQRAGVTLTTNIAGEPPVLDIDPVRIGEVIGNLVDNAIKHTPSGGSVHVDAISLADSVQITVTDTGGGIDPSVLPNLFQRFVKGADSRGTGLGLAIVRSLVELHGGTVAVKSEMGVGSTFTVRLPVR